eukprot:5643551-Amphidinium_carterae.1
MQKLEKEKGEKGNANKTEGMWSLLQACMHANPRVSSETFDPTCDSGVVPNDTPRLRSPRPAS